MTTFMFPGQGSQKEGMGQDFFEMYPDMTDQADAILGYSIRELCLENPDGKLMLTQYTQPALFVVSCLMHRNRVEEVTPDYLAGHSLGEYSALYAAGAFDFETGLRLVKKRGELMSEAGPGGMAAVIRLSEEEIARVLKDNGLDAIDIANYNSPEQIVISGPKQDIERAQPFFEKAGARMYSILKVSSAFHSRYMKDARDTFATFLDAFAFDPLKIPVISNVAARPYRDDQIKTLLADQITHSVKWTETMRYLMAKGEEEFEEIGPGKVLMGLYRKIVKLSEPLAVATETPVARSAEPESGPQPSREVDADAARLGAATFRQAYQLKYAYVAGSFQQDLVTPEMVIRMARAGMMAYLGVGGLSLAKIEHSIRTIRERLGNGESFGLSLNSNLTAPETEERTVDLYLEQGIDKIEAVAYLQITPALARYRLKGLTEVDGEVQTKNRVMARVSRPEVAHAFLSPPPERLVQKLLTEGKITEQEAALAHKTPMADDLCVEADSGGNTDQGVAYALMPAMIALREELVATHGYRNPIHLGASGGIGAPEAAAAALILGVEFIVVNSINQCTVEAGTSDMVKDMLQSINVQDTAYAPAADMFEIGAKMQVLKKGAFFPARANKLYALYQHHGGLSEIDAHTSKQIQDKYFKRSFDEIWREIRDGRLGFSSDEIARAERNPKHKMALVFKWYFDRGYRAAVSGDAASKVDFLVYCGPAMGAFNQWVKGSDLEDWRNRRADIIGNRLMRETAALLKNRCRTLFADE